jgi:hypothetical protein
LATAATADGELQRRHRDPLPEGDVGLGERRPALERRSSPGLSPGRSIAGRAAEAEGADGVVEIRVATRSAVLMVPTFELFAITSRKREHAEGLVVGIRARRRA